MAHEDNNAAACPASPNFVYSYAVEAAGHITAIQATDSAAQAGSGTTISVRLNGAVVLSCTAAAGSATGDVNACENVGSIAVAKGDFIQVQVAKNAGGTDASWKTYVTLGT